MKHRLLLSVAAGVLVATGSAVWVLACDKEARAKSAAVASASKGRTASKAACTPAEAAACRAKEAAAVAAASSSVPDCCAAKAKKARAAARTAAADASCEGKEKAAVTAVAEPGEIDAVPAGSGYSCGGGGVATTADRGAAHGCDACADMADCDGELKSSGAVTQVVKLKNGIMYVYTAKEPGKVRAVQAAVAQRHDRMAALQASGEKAHLCRDCKSMRGAIASGKLTREVVTIEGGCLTLVTSVDRALVSKLHSMVAQHAASRVKT